MLDAIMQARLEHLDVRGLELRMDDKVRAVLGEMVSLRGELVQDRSRIAVERAAAARAEVATLELAFGTFRLASEGSVVFDELRGRFEQAGAGVRAELQADGAEAARLRITIALPSGKLSITGRVMLSGVRLRIEAASGGVFAEKLVLSDVALELAGSTVAVDALEGAHVAVDWGREGVRVRAASASIGAATVVATFAPPAEATAAADVPATTEPPARRPGAWRDLLPALDGLAGQLDVDVGVDITVPVLGSRRATHKFRLPIENGALDYLQLENGLSRLEDALLDFAMRDDSLVLEMSVPLLPRGRGKPILRWNVDGDDLVLARANRIRLALLPQFQSASGGGDDEGAGSGKSPLRELSLWPLDAKLRLENAAPPAALPLRRIGELSVRAELHHAAETTPRDGTASVRLADVDLGTMTIALGAMTLGFDVVTLASAEADAEFAGIKPRAVRAKLRGLHVEDLDLGPRG